MKRRDFIKSSICFGCINALELKFLFADANEIVFTPEEELAMQKFVYKSVDELPKKIRLDICNLCQLNCPCCWVRMEEKRLIEQNAFGYVSFNQFKKFIDKNPNIEEIEIANHGEIFLNPDFDKIIEYAYKKNVALTAYAGVNMNKLTEETAENLVKYKFRAITVSIDGATPETYEIYRRGGNFNTVVQNIKKINKYKKLYKSVFPNLTYKFVVFGHNEHEILKAKDIASSLGMGILYEPNYVKDYSPVKNPQKVKELVNLGSLNFTKEHLENFNKDKSKFFPCDGLFTCPQINAKGYLVGCCCPVSYHYGENVFEEDLIKVLNNKIFLYTKLILSDFSFKPKIDIPCRDCYTFNILKNQNLSV